MSSGIVQESPPKRKAQDAGNSSPKYVTSEIACSCPDFRFRKMREHGACKHMTRLVGALALVEAYHEQQRRLGRLTPRDVREEAA